MFVTGKSSNKRTLSLPSIWKPKEKKNSVDNASKPNRFNSSWYDQDLVTLSDSLMGLKFYVPEGETPEDGLSNKSAGMSIGKKPSNVDKQLLRELQMELYRKERYIQDLEARLELSENPSSMSLDDGEDSSSNLTALSDYMLCVFGESKKDNEAFC